MSCLLEWKTYRTNYVFFKIKGRIVEEPKGETKYYHWSDLAKVFIHDDYEHTEAELNVDT